MAGMTIRHLPKGWFAKPSPMALGINRTLYWLRVPIMWGLGLSWSIALVSELHVFHVEIMIICEIGALIILVLLIRYLFSCCCLARRFALPSLMCGFAYALINPESFYGGSECFLSGCNRSDNWK